MTDAALTQKYVVPYYMNRTGSTDESAREFVEVARTASADDVISLLSNSGWREQRVGALLALVRDETSVRAALFAGLLAARTAYAVSHLVVTVYEVAGADGIPALEEYLSTVITHDPQSTTFVAHAIDLLHGRPSDADDATLREFAELHTAAQRIRAAVRG